MLRLLQKHFISVRFNNINVSSLRMAIVPHHAAVNR